MSTAIKLAIVGAGSAQFSLGLVRDLCLTPALSGSSIALMDIDADRLEMVTRLAVRYAAELGADLRFEQTTERAAVITDASAVINTALAGGHSREEAERDLLERHGYYRGLHPSEGFFHQLRLMLDIARDVERLAPEAWLIQSSNPVYDGCTLMTRQTGARVLGLCHGPFGGIRELAAVLGLDQNDVAFEAPGLNHCVWLTRFRYLGKDAYPLLDRWIADAAEEHWRAAPGSFSRTQLSRAAIHLYRLYGLLPLGDTSRAIWPEAWWYHLDIETKKYWWGDRYGGFDSEIGWSAYLDHLAASVRRIAEVASDSMCSVTELFPPEPSGEQIVPIIDALVNDRPGTFLVNVPNRGALPGLPDDVVVEVPAIVDGSGIRPVRVEPLPHSIMLGAIYPQWLAMERRLAAFINRDPRYLLQVLLAEQRTRSFDHAEDVLNAIMAMPGNEAMADHYGAVEIKA